jgi:hypothetical protein
MNELRDHGYSHPHWGSEPHEDGNPQPADKPIRLYDVDGLYGLVFPAYALMRDASRDRVRLL